MKWKQQIDQLRQERDMLLAEFNKLPHKGSLAGINLGEALDFVQKRLDELGDRSERYELEIDLEIGD